jgi:hypothetical protein
MPFALQVLRPAFPFLPQAIFWHLPMSTLWEFIYGKSSDTKVSEPRIHKTHRANRAQYTEVSWRSAAEVEMTVSESTALPSMQGTNEEEGERIPVSGRTSFE